MFSFENLNKTLLGSPSPFVRCGHLYHSPYWLQQHIIRNLRSSLTLTEDATITTTSTTSGTTTIKTEPAAETLFDGEGVQKSVNGSLACATADELQSLGQKMSKARDELETKISTAQKTVEEVKNDYQSALEGRPDYTFIIFR